MNLIYPAVFHKEESGGFWVTFPDLKGCNTCGETLEESMINAKEALEGYCASVLERQLKLKPASEMGQIKSDEDAFVTLIVGDMKKYLNESKAVKKTLTIPSWLNEVAVKNNVNFSGILQDALIERLHIENPQ